MNMSYCRFHNTDIDLRDCVGALEDLDLPESDDELMASRRLYHECKNYIKAYEMEYGTEDEWEKK